MDSFIVQGHFHCKPALFEVSVLGRVSEGLYGLPEAILRYQKQGGQNGPSTCTKARHQFDVALSCIQYVCITSYRWPHQQKRGTTVPDLNERIVDVAGDNAVAPAPPKPTPALPPPHSVFSQPGSGGSIAILSPIPAITPARDPQRFAQWDKGNAVPQRQIHTPNQVKPLGNALPTTTPPPPAPAPVTAICGISVSPTQAAVGSTVTLTVTASGAKSLRVTGNGFQGIGVAPVSYGPYSLPATGGTLSVTIKPQPANTAVTFSVTASPGSAGGQSVSQSCKLSVT